MFFLALNTTKNTASNPENMSLNFSKLNNLQLVTNVQQDIKVAPAIWRKPKVFRHWLLSAHRANITFIALLILVPFAFTPLFDYLLEAIFTPIAGDILFGLIRTQEENPSLIPAQTFTHWLLWITSLVVVIYLYIRHMPPTFNYAQQITSDKEHQADKLIDVKPTESILLYNAACEWAVTEKNESAITTKLNNINSKLNQNNTESSHNPEPISDASETVVVTTTKQEPKIIADRYKIKEELGTGAMGVVYLAEDTRLKRDVALKQLSPGSLSNEHLLARFRQEAMALARLSHPNITQIYDFLESGDFLWIVMELAEGCELTEKLESAEKPTLNEIIQLALPMAKGLGYAHERGVVHRDFKPANILITKNGEVKITDFGIAKLAQSSVHTQINTILGSPAYMSPEQANGDNTDHRTDIYAFGVVLYLMICGELPFKGEAKSIIAQHLTKKAPSIRDKNKGIPSKLNTLVQKLLAKDPNKRYQSMDEVVRILESKANWSVKQ